MKISLFNRQKRWITRGFLLFIICFLGWAQTQKSSPSIPQDRFVWIFGWNLLKDSDWNQVLHLLDRASAAGYNGVVLSAGLDRLSLQPKRFLDRLEAFQKRCDADGLELIPSLFSIGYAGSLLAHNPNLAEGLPVRDLLFRVSADGRKAVWVPDRIHDFVNGGFEEHRGNRFPGYRFHDQPGVVSFADTRIFHSGRCSIRLENFQANPHGHGRVMQEIAVQPWRLYRVSAWVKTENLVPADRFQILILTEHRNLTPRTLRLPATTDWRKVTVYFNSMTNRRVRVYMGIWGGRAGRFWLDDWHIEPVGPINILRRPGTPVHVRSADHPGVEYREGVDFAPLRDPHFSLSHFDHPPVTTFRILSGSRIRPGERLLVTFYHPMVIHSSQITACMAEPEVYRIWDREAALLARHIKAHRFLLSMDEIRMGGTCEACRGRNMGELLGECITRACRILRRHFPGAEIYCWSDMLDPNHNAHANYYLVDGDFSGSWNHVPKDLRIAVWGGTPRPKSLRFFAEHHFQMLIACYYDAANLQDVEDWRKAAQGLPGIRGYMYTIWQRKYNLLEDFARLLWGQKRAGRAVR